MNESEISWLLVGEKGPTNIFIFVVNFKNVFKTRRYILELTIAK